MEIDLTKLTNTENITEPDLRYLYLELNLTKKWCAEIFNCSEHIVKKHLKLYGFSKSNKMIAESQKKYMLYKTGYSNAMKNPKHRQKLKESLQKTFSKHGQEIAEKRKQTCLNNYGVENPSQSSIVKNKKKQTTLNNHGVDNPFKSSAIRRKIKETCNQKYGGLTWEANSSLRSKYEETMIEKYGCINPMQNSEISNQVSNTLKQNQELYKQRNIEKYGVAYPTSLEETKKKINDTKRKNSTFNCSKIEDRIYAELCQIFSEVIRQYRCESYPFSCDFYIPSLQLFIEYNGHWTHGGHPFDPSKDFKTLELWKKKDSKYFNNAIYTWTDLDVRKLNCAIKNDLNYKVFYNEKDFKDWIKEYHTKI